MRFVSHLHCAGANGEYQGHREQCESCDTMSLGKLVYSRCRAGTTCDDRSFLEKTPQIFRKLSCRLVAVGRVSRHRLQHDCLEFNGHRSIQSTWRNGFIERQTPEEFLAVVTRVGGFERQQLVQRNAQRIDVRAMVHDHALGQRLLRASYNGAFPTDRRSS